MRLSKLSKIVIAAGAAALLFGQGDTTLQKAIRKETVEGDLKGAIELYRKAVGQAAKDRATAAQALVRMGACYEQLGDAEARKAYERVVREYADQKDAAAEARKRLAGKTQPQSGVVAQRIWADGIGGRSYRAVSPDGRYAVFSTREGALYTHDLAFGEVRRLMEPLAERQFEHLGMALSQDGKRIAYSTRKPEVQLWIMDIDGANARLLINNKELRNILVFDWTADGKQLLGAVVDAKGGKDVWFSVADGSYRIIDALTPRLTGLWRLSPDGRFFAGVKWEAKDNGCLRLVPVQGGTPVTLVDGNDGYSYTPNWTPDGKRVVFFSRRRGIGDLWAIPVADGKPAGEPEIVKEGLGAFGSPIGFTHSGDFYYGQKPAAHEVYVADIDSHSGALTAAPVRITEHDYNWRPVWSPDGDGLAYWSQTGAVGGRLLDLATGKLVIRDVKSGQERIVAPKTQDLVAGYQVQWFPDGRSLLLWLIPPAAWWEPGQPVRMDMRTGDIQYLLPKNVKPGPAWVDNYPGAVMAPDGRFVCYTAGDPGRLMRQDLPGGETKELLTINGTDIHAPFISRDSTRVAFWVGDSKLMIMSAEGGVPVDVRTGLTLGPATETRAGSLTRRRDASGVWSPDGRRLFFVTRPAAGELASDEIWSVPVEGGKATPLGIHLHQIWTMDLSPDGKRLVFADVRTQQETWVVKNLFADVKASR